MGYWATRQSGTSLLVLAGRGCAIFKYILLVTWTAAGDWWTPIILDLNKVYRRTDSHRNIYQMSNIPNCQFITLCDQLGKRNIFCVYVPIYFFYFTVFCLMWVGREPKYRVFLILSLSVGKYCVRLLKCPTDKRVEPSGRSY